MNQVGLLGLFVGLLANACLGSQLDEFQSNGLALAGDAASIDQKIMDTDIKRSGMNGTNNIIGAEMEACEDKKPEKTCQKWKKKGKCATEKVAKVCKKTCDLCQDDCHDTLESLHCLSGCPTPVSGSNASNYHHILGRCYYFEETPMNFTEAMENCETRFGTKKKNTGRLFEPRNSKVNDAVAEKGKTVANPEDQFTGSEWIGIRTDSNITSNSTTYRNFFWLSGGNFTSLSYGQWFSGEPNNSGGDEKCVQIYTLIDGTWNDIPCNQTYPSICEMGHEVIW